VPAKISRQQDKLVDRGLSAASPASWRRPSWLCGASRPWRRLGRLVENVDNQHAECHYEHPVLLKECLLFWWHLLTLLAWCGLLPGWGEALTESWVRLGCRRICKDMHALPLASHTAAGAGFKRQHGQTLAAALRNRCQRSHNQPVAVRVVYNWLQQGRTIQTHQCIRADVQARHGKHKLGVRLRRPDG
jgi:hypothetical protein